MRIALNYYLKAKSTDEGIRLFGKAGYQTQNPKADKFTNTNLGSVLTLWKAGQLKDIDGNVCVFGDGRTPVIDVYASVALINDGEVERVDEVRNSAGGVARVPATAPTAAAEDDEPF